MILRSRMGSCIRPRAERTRLTLSSHSQVENTHGLHTSWTPGLLYKQVSLLLILYFLSTWSPELLLPQKMLKAGIPGHPHSLSDQFNQTDRFHQVQRSPRVPTPHITYNLHKP